MLHIPKVQIAIRISHILNRLPDMAPYAYLPLNEIIVHYPLFSPLPSGPFWESNPGPWSLKSKPLPPWPPRQGWWLVFCLLFVLILTSKDLPWHLMLEAHCPFVLVRSPTLELPILLCLEAKASLLLLGDR